MSENERIARETLEDARSRTAPEIDLNLLHRIYDIEAKYQFAKDRSFVRDLIRQMVDDYVSAQSTSE